MGFLGFLGSCGQAGANGPDGFIGDDQVGYLLRGEILEAALELDFQHGFQNAPQAFVLRFSDAENGGDACGDGLLDFGVDNGIRFSEILAAFAVAEHHILEVQFIQHAGGDFTGISSVVVLGDVLGSGGDAGATAQSVLHGGNGGEGRDDDHVTRDVFPLNEVFEAFDELGAFGGADVHLPVGGNDGFAGHNGMILIRNTHC